MYYQIGKHIILLIFQFEEVKNSAEQEGLEIVRLSFLDFLSQCFFSAKITLILFIKTYTN
jgi:hypothetical protein